MSLQAQTLTVTKVKEDVAKIGLDAKVWQKVKTDEVIIYPQTALSMNDADALKLNADNKAKILHVKSVNDGQSVAFWVQWKDTTKSVQEGLSSTAYADGFAMQFSTVKDKLPYIGMGNEGRPVIVHLQKATGVTFEPNNNGDVYHQVNASNQNAFGKELKVLKKEVAQQAITDYQRVFISEGFRSLTQLRDNSEPSVMQMRYAKGVWTALLVRGLKSEHLNLEGTFPVAFAVWDGEAKNRDGVKRLSAWVGVNVDGTKKALALLDEVSGDVKNGEKVVMENCSVCHQYKAVKNAPDFMAPNLSNIGGYGNASYIKESIVDPSAVAVPGYNANAHKNFLWYIGDDKGVRASTMPPFVQLDEKSVNDAVAYLKTLKAEVEK
jgi:complex iron-sulfur molybdoenzyme family reductase subunit gamma